MSTKEWQRILYNFHMPGKTNAKGPASLCAEAGPLIWLPFKISDQKKEKGEQECDEGCLSFPNQFAKIIRPKEVEVEALDREGKKFKLKAKDLLAQAVAHEIDHLDGIVFIDRMIPGTLEYVDNSQN